MIRRVAQFNLTLLICIDQLIQTLTVGLWWAVTGRGKRPDPDETISAYCGRGALRGRRWGRVFSAPIDLLFHILTGEKDHCLRAGARQMGGK